MNKPTLEQIAGARAYEALHVPALFRQWCPLMLDAAGVTRNDRVLDVDAPAHIVTGVAGGDGGGNTP